MARLLCLANCQDGVISEEVKGNRSAINMKRRNEARPRRGRSNSSSPPRQRGTKSRRRVTGVTNEDSKDSVKDEKPNTPSKQIDSDTSEESTGSKRQSQRISSKESDIKKTPVVTKQTVPKSRTSRKTSSDSTSKAKDEVENKPSPPLPMSMPQSPAVPSPSTYQPPVQDHNVPSPAVIPSSAPSINQIPQPLMGMSKIEQPLTDLKLPERVIAKPPKKRKADLDSEAFATPPPLQKRPSIDLEEWKNQRVLAKRNGVYVPGVIKDIKTNVSLGILFDEDTSLCYYQHIFDVSIPEIISDHSPRGVTVSVGARVCVRISSDANVFYPGYVMEKKLNPIIYRVKLENRSPDQEVMVSRANLRLLQPPWYEDLEEMEMDFPLKPPLTQELRSPMSMRTDQHSAGTPVTPLLDQSETDDEIYELEKNFDSSGMSTPRSGSATPGSGTRSQNGRDRRQPPKKRDSARSRSAQSTESSRCSTPRSPNSNTKYKKGDVVSTPNGIRKKFNGKQWRRLCSKDGCTKESQRRGFCSRHLSLKGKGGMRQPTFPGCHKGEMKDSGNLEWNDSREGEYQQRYETEETEAANMLVSLGNSRSGTPAFSPTPQTPVSPRIQSPAGSGIYRSSNSFTPISPHPNSQYQHTFVGSPARSWSSKSGSSSSEHVSPITPRFPSYHQQQQKGLPVPAKPHALSLSKQDLGRSEDSGIGIDIRTPKTPLSKAASLSNVVGIQGTKAVQPGMQVQQSVYHSTVDMTAKAHPDLTKSAHYLPQNRPAASQQTSTISAPIIKQALGQPVMTNSSQQQGRTYQTYQAISAQQNRISEPAPNTHPQMRANEHEMKRPQNSMAPPEQHHSIRFHQPVQHPSPVNLLPVIQRGSEVPKSEGVAAVQIVNVEKDNNHVPVVAEDRNIVSKYKLSVIFLFRSVSIFEY
ncbi:hypothetical protein LOTGIDRAFT_153178 [Lottia gigantea]|uniref:Protein capicua homolog-like domain-containing protein n=1 Tax=Lottia gigantea TaxID=225164 RepID=V4AJH4_LOTGI|nr:hypothetical protein LOTGIDRAFT_153178 [Lottia gigantea]ESO93721.1 hypothetical protein LOTGIDRAFT_153178 [Lottia gigantea]